MDKVKIPEHKHKPIGGGKTAQKGAKAMKTIDEMRKNGYPLKIIGNDGYCATLVGCQPLLGGDYTGIYRYPGGDCCHSINEIKSCCKVVEW